MNISLQRAAAVLRMQTREFLRDFGSVFLSFVFPLLFVMALVASNLVSPTMRFTFGVVDPHRNPGAAELMSAMTSPGLTFRTVDEARGRAELQDGKLQALLFIPRASLHSGEGTIDALTDTQNEGVVRMALDAARARLLLADSAGKAAYPVQLNTFSRPSDLKFAFIFPGMLALALVQLGMFATATPLLKARERGTLRYMLLTPLTVTELLIGQVGMRIGVALLQVALLLAVGALLVPLSVLQWLAVAGVSMLGVAMMVAIGYALAGLPRSLEAGMAMIMIANFVMMFGGNIFWDPQGSVALQVVAHLLPASYLADAYRQLIGGREGLWPLWLDIAVMAGWTALAVAFAVRTFSFDMTHRPRRARRLESPQTPALRGAEPSGLCPKLPQPSTEEL